MNSMNQKTNEALNTALDKDDSEDAYTETLVGHTSEETAFVVDDYPYGFRLRTQIRYWIESNNKRGQRFCSQTLNPKTGRWNKPKKSTYSPVMVMVRNPNNGYVSYQILMTGGWSKEDKITAFEERHAAALGEFEKSAIKYIRLSNRAYSKMTWTIGSHSDDDEPAQTREEQLAMVNHAIRAEYAIDAAEQKRKGAS